MPTSKPLTATEVLLLREKYKRKTNAEIDKKLAPIMSILYLALKRELNEKESTNIK